MSSLILFPRAINLVYLLFFVSLALTAFQPPAYAQTQMRVEPKFTPLMQKVIGQAKAEGKVVLSTSSVKWTADEAARLSQALQAYFGIPVKVELASPGGTVKFINRLREEAKAGIQPPVDQLCTGVVNIAGARQAGIVHEVDWKALGVPAWAYLGDVNAPYVEINARPFIYNTKLVKEADIPRKHEDLLHAKFKGRIVAPAQPTLFPYLVPVMGEEGALGFVKRLVNQQQLVLVAEMQDSSQRVANGEFLIGYGHDGANLIKRGAPIAIAPLKHGGTPNGCWIVKNAAHPAAAQLLAYFLTSTPEGAKAAEEILEWSKPKPGEETYVVAVDSQWLMQHSARLTELFKKALRL